MPYNPYASHPDWRVHACNFARTQHRAFFRSMSEGGTWNLYRIGATATVVMLRDDAPGITDALHIVVPNVQALTDTQVVNRLLTELSK